jgi:hypothetical protein
MNAVVSIEVALDTGHGFSESGRERRAAVARALRCVFAGPDWNKDDNVLESVFDAVEIEHRYDCPEEGASVTVKERSAPGLRLVRENVVDRGAEGRRETAREILLYLEAVAMAFADRDVTDRDGVPGAGAGYEGVLPWSEAARRVVCRRAGEACADLAALLDGRAPCAGEGRLSALGVLETAAETLRRLEADLGGLRLSLGPARFRETAEWSGSPARVRGVYRPSVWEKAIREYTRELGDEDADFMYECVRDHRSVWPLGLKFTTDFFPLALKLFRLAAEEGDLLPDITGAPAQSGWYPLYVGKSV